MAEKSTRKGNSNSVIVLVIVAVLVGWTAGYIVGNTFTNEEPESQYFAEPEEGAYPSVTVEAEKDEVSGYDVYIKTENFTFTPENAGEENVYGQGHAHLYVNGEKVARVYGNWYHLDDLGEGEHTITVGLNQNNHEAYMADGKNVEASVVVASDGHTHSDDEPHSHDDESEHSDDHSHN